MIFPRKKKITQKRLNQLKRNSGGEKYKEWRNYVLDRDGHCCQHPGCYESKNLQVHHIKRFSTARHLRTAKHNGITLCREHHEMIYGREQLYELLYFKIVQANEKKYNPD